MRDSCPLLVQVHITTPTIQHFCMIKLQILMAYIWRLPATNPELDLAPGQPGAALGFSLC